MKCKLEVLGIGVLAAIATAALAVMEAGATQGGNFEFATAHSTVTASENGINHSIHIKSNKENIGCKSASYTGTVTNTKASQIDLVPEFKTCYTTAAPEKEVKIDANGCSYRFTVAFGGVTGTMDISCPVGAKMEIHHPNCTINVPTQENITGVNYVTVIDSLKHALTVELNSTAATVEYHGGICIFLGTKNTANLVGSMTLWAEDTKGARVDMTAI